jgi:hypothetical protein
MRSPGQCLATLPAESVIQEIKDVLDQRIINFCLVHRQVSSLLMVRRPGDTISGFESGIAVPTRASMATVLTRLTEIRRHRGGTGVCWASTSAWDAAMPPGMLRLRIEPAVLIDYTKAPKSCRVSALRMKPSSAQQAMA